MDVKHLLPTRGELSACGQLVCEEALTPEINCVTCDDCIKVHDDYCEQFMSDD